jgi:hypothetical protein
MNNKYTIYLYRTLSGLTPAAQPMEDVNGWELVGRKEVEFLPEDMLSDDEIKQARLESLKQLRDKIAGNHDLAKIDAEIKALTSGGEYD